MKPDDKPQKNEETYEDPKLFMVVDDKIVPKPGLETAFVAIIGNRSSQSEQKTVLSSTRSSVGQKAIVRNANSLIGQSTITSGTNSQLVPTAAIDTTEIVNWICTCNKVAVQSCSCVGYVRPSRGGGTYRTVGCRCAPVH